jgi:hypothetical protein
MKRTPLSGIISQFHPSIGDGQWWMTGSQLTKVFQSAVSDTQTMVIIEQINWRIARQYSFLVVPWCQDVTFSITALPHKMVHVSTWKDLSGRLLRQHGQHGGRIGNLRTRQAALGKEQAEASWWLGWPGRSATAQERHYPPRNSPIPANSSEEAKASRTTPEVVSVSNQSQEWSRYQIQEPRWVSDSNPRPRYNKRKYMDTTPVSGWRRSKPRYRELIQRISIKTNL